MRNFEQTSSLSVNCELENGSCAQSGKLLDYRFSKRQALCEGDETAQLIEVHYKEQSCIMECPFIEVM